MRLTTLILSGLLALGSGLSGTALAHDGGRGYYKYDYSHRYQPRHRHWRRHPHYRGHRDWGKGHGYRPHRRWWPRHDDDGWYGVYLYFGGR